MTYATEKQVILNNRIYDVESISTINGQTFADATYKVDGILHNVECDEIRLALGKRIKC